VIEAARQTTGKTRARSFADLKEYLQSIRKKSLTADNLLKWLAGSMDDKDLTEWLKAY
jgi:hypothetical protein